MVTPWKQLSKISFQVLHLEKLRCAPEATLDLLNPAGLDPFLWIGGLRENHPPHLWQADPGSSTVFQQDLQWVVTDSRAWQLSQWCCLLQKPHIFILVWNHHILMKSSICAARITLQVPPPFAAAKTPALAFPILFLSSSNDSS